MPRGSANQKIAAATSARGPDRNVVPWKEMERRVAEQIAAKAKTKGGPNSARGGGRTSSGRSDVPPWKQSAAPQASIPNPSVPLDTDDFLDTVLKASTVEEAPKSGPRVSEPRLPAARALTFTVYSVEELDARQRVSAPPASTPPPPPSRWPDVWRSAKALLRAWQAWYRTPKPRSRLMDVCGIPLATFRADLFAAVEQLPWRKILVRGGIGFASVFFLLFAVLTAAELTDDLTPGAPRGATSKVETTNAVAAVPSSAPPAESVDGPAIELEDDAPAAATAGKKAVVPAKKPASSKKKSGDRPSGKKGSDVFNP